MLACSIQLPNTLKKNVILQEPLYAKINANTEVMHLAPKVYKS